MPSECRFVNYTALPAAQQSARAGRQYVSRVSLLLIFAPPCTNTSDRYTSKVDTQTVTKLLPHLSKNRQRTVLARIQPQLLFIPSYSSRTVGSCGCWKFGEMDVRGRKALTPWSQRTAGGLLEPTPATARAESRGVEPCLAFSPNINKEEEAEVEVSHRHESTPVCVLKVEEGPVTGWTEQLMKSTTFNFLRQLFWQAGEGVGDAWSHSKSEERRQEEVAL